MASPAPLSRYRSRWYSGSRPAYSAISVNEGLLTVAVTPRPAANPLANSVLPAPSGPNSASRSPGTATAARRDPRRPRRGGRPARASRPGGAAVRSVTIRSAPGRRAPPARTSGGLAGTARLEGHTCHGPDHAAGETAPADDLEQPADPAQPLAGGHPDPIPRFRGDGRRAVEQGQRRVRADTDLPPLGAQQRGPRGGRDGPLAEPVQDEQREGWAGVEGCPLPGLGGAERAEVASPPRRPR